MRLPLPFRLDHVNVYLVEDGDGFALIDTGIDNAVSRELWEGLFAGPLRGKTLTRILATHFHPDHIGLAGWLCRRFDLPLHASQTEYLDALRIRLDPGALNSEPYRGFYHSHGLSQANTELLLSRGLELSAHGVGLCRAPSVASSPARRLEIGGRVFDVTTGGGHSSEQILLHCRELNVLLCADQVLAKITPNISVEAMDPDGDPLGHLSAIARSTRNARCRETFSLCPGISCRSSAFPRGSTNSWRITPRGARRSSRPASPRPNPCSNSCRSCLDARSRILIRCRSRSARRSPTPTISSGESGCVPRRRRKASFSRLSNK